jgi:hypothetical protein
MSAEIEGIEFIQYLAAVNAESAKCLVEGPLRAGGRVGWGPAELGGGGPEPEFAVTPDGHGLGPGPPKISASR